MATNGNKLREFSAEGALQYQDWRERYGAIRNATGTSFPGYLSHEAVDWDAAGSRAHRGSRICSGTCGPLGSPATRASSQAR